MGCTSITGGCSGPPNAATEPQAVIVHCARAHEPWFYLANALRLLRSQYIPPIVNTVLGITS